MSKFKHFLIKEIKVQEPEIVLETLEVIEEAEFLNPLEIIKKSGVKVKAQLPTDFGVQFELYKKTDVEDIKKFVKDSKLLVKGNYIFILF